MRDTPLYLSSFVSLASAAAFACLAGAAAAAAAPSPNPFDSDMPYSACLDEIENDADNAWEMARMWGDLGGGAEADHCAALALLELGHYGDAAERLEMVARRNGAGSAAERAAIFNQSGNAWLLAGRPDKAQSAFSSALRLSPRDVASWTDRARAWALKEDWEGAESDLTSALVFDQRKPEIYVLRASARSAQGKSEAAKSDIDTALLLDPDFPDALVDRGAMKLAQGDENGARADWVRVLLVDPYSLAGDAARAHIEKLDVNPDL